MTGQNFGFGLTGDMQEIECRKKKKEMQIDIPSFVQYPIIIKDVNKVLHESWMTALEGCGNG